MTEPNNWKEWNKTKEAYQHTSPPSGEPPRLASYEESSRYFQAALLAERRKVQVAETCSIRLINWLRGEDHEFGEWILEIRRIRGNVSHDTHRPGSLDQQSRS